MKQLARFVYLSFFSDRYFPSGRRILQGIKNRDRHKDLPRSGGGKENRMNKVSAFFKDCWSDYVDFMGKYGEYVNRF